MMWTGAWRRPHSYGDPAAEVRARARARRRDRRLDARQAPRRRAPTRRRSSTASTRTASPTSRSGRVRYGVLDDRRRPDHGRRHGRPPRRRALLRDDDLDRRRRRATSGSSGGTRSGACDVEIVNVTGALAAINVAGPRCARGCSRALTDARRLERGASRYLDAQRAARSRACPCLALRIGFVGELGYELHCPEPATPSTSGTRSSRRRRGAVRARAAADPAAREGALIVGQDTDSESNLLSAGMPWIVEARQGRLRRQVGARARRRSAASRERLVGFEMPERRRCRSRARRSSRRPTRAAASRARAASGRVGSDDRPRLGARPTSPRRDARSRSGSTARLEPATRARSRRSTTPTGSGCGRERGSTSSRRDASDAEVAARSRRSRARSTTRRVDDLARSASSRCAAGVAARAAAGEELAPTRAGSRAARRRRARRCARARALWPSGSASYDMSAALAGLEVEGEG